MGGNLQGVKATYVDEVLRGVKQTCVDGSLQRVKATYMDEVLRGVKQTCVGGSLQEVKAHRLNGIQKESELCFYTDENPNGKAANAAFLCLTVS